MRPLLFKLTARPALLAALLFLVGFGLTASLPAYFGWPQPVLHDEFAYLFEAETFADGRLTNPPPIGPPESFATFHHLISPVYIGKFPPGQGLALAMGVLLGHAIIGVWIINGLWAIALYWMLRGVAPPGWSLLGAVAGVATYGAFSYWGQTYWGGSVLALGGTLTFGGALHLLKRRGCPYAASTLAGLGCGIMALTRPLDGFIFALWPAAAILWLALRALRAKKSAAPGRLLAFIAPALAGVGLMFAYNAATTGNPLQFAHRLYDNTFVPRLVLFVWQKPGPTPPNEPRYLTEYQNAYADNMAADPLTWDAQLANATGFLADQRDFFLPLPTFPLLVLGILGALFWRDRVARFALVSLAFLLIPFAILRYYGFPHYAAAWSAPILVLLVQGARQATAGLRRRRLGWRWLPFAACAALLLAAPVEAVVGVLDRGSPGWMGPPYYWARDRQAVTEVLTDRFEKTGHRQLVAILYPPGHNPHDEWVFNGPDPSAQPVLWARSLSVEADKKLFAAYPDYDHWLLKTDTEGRFVKEKFVLIYTPPPASGTPAALASASTPAAPATSTAPASPVAPVTPASPAAPAPSPAH